MEVLDSSDFFFLWLYGQLYKAFIVVAENYRLNSKWDKMSGYFILKKQSEDDNKSL